MFLGLLALGFGWEKTRERNFHQAIPLLFIGFWLALIATRIPYVPEWTPVLQKETKYVSGR
jgi:hypothetical protein